MAGVAAHTGFKGAANWFRIQAKEEAGHAMKFYDYLIDQQAQVVLDEIKAPPSSFKSLLDMFERTLEHEKVVTQLIGGLMNLALSEKDHATAVALQWFVSEQVEEEATANEIVGQLTMVGQSSGSLLMIDHQLSKRS